MTLREVYQLSCDGCGATMWYDGRWYLPQDVLAHASIQRSWTNYGELVHCDVCPPLCGRCGSEDVDHDTECGLWVVNGQG